MNILLISPQPFFSPRGTPMAVRELATAYGALGHHVDILTYHLGEDISAANVHIIRTKLFSRSIRFVRPGYSLNKIILDCALFPKALLRIVRRRYDVVHCVEESAYVIPWFRWLKRFLFVLDMDSDIRSQLEYSGKITNKRVLSFVKMMERFAVSRADAVVTIGPIFTDAVRALFPQKPVFQIEDVSVDDEIPPPAWHTEGRTILYTGNFESYQGVDILLDGFVKISDKWPDAKLLIVGGEEEEVRALRKRYNAPAIVFAGKKPVGEMSRYLAEADILVSPRASGENTPYKIYSYLAAGKPILATRIVSHTQILHDGEDAVLVEPTADGMAEGLDSLLRDAELAKKIGAGGRKLFDARYSRERYREKVSALVKFLEDRLSDGSKCKAESGVG